MQDLCSVSLDVQDRNWHLRSRKFLRNSEKTHTIVAVFPEKTIMLVLPCSICWSVRESISLKLKGLRLRSSDSDLASWSGSLLRQRSPTAPVEKPPTRAMLPALLPKKPEPKLWGPGSAGGSHGWRLRCFANRVRHRYWSFMDGQRRLPTLKRYVMSPCP
jgi:hypothetical protein